MTWLIFELWGLFLATAAIGFFCGTLFSSLWGSHASKHPSRPAKQGKVEGKVIKTTIADMVPTEAENRGHAYPIEQVEGVGKTYAKKLKSIGVRQTHDLLDLCQDDEGRNRLAKYLKVSVGEVTRWTSMADLMRISGVGGQFAELLEAGKVRTVTDLSSIKPEALAKKIALINAKTPKSRQVPDADRIAEWAKQAKKMDSPLSF